MEEQVVLPKTLKKLKAEFILGNTMWWNNLWHFHLKKFSNVYGSNKKATMPVFASKKEPTMSTKNVTIYFYLRGS